jgi:hypothetical protein
LNASFRDLSTRICGAALCLVAASAAAAPRVVEPFEAGTWQTLQTRSQPAAVVFTTTDCVHCPAVIDQLARKLHQRAPKAALMTVVMDVEPGDSDAELLRNTHYIKADRLFAFSGQAPAIRYAIDPHWRGVTPYVVFLTPNTPAAAVIGPPSATDIDTWLRTAAKPGRAWR